MSVAIEDSYVPYEIIIKCNMAGDLDDDDISRKMIEEALIDVIAELVYGYDGGFAWVCNHKPNERIQVTIRKDLSELKANEKK